MARGGKRARAGRKKGSLTRRTQELVAKAAADGAQPLEIMLRNMRFADRKALELQAQIELRGSATQEELKEILALQATAQTFARDAAPYCHPRLAAVEQRDELAIDFDHVRDQIAALGLETARRAQSPLAT
jgi:hypothetical protein